MVQQFAAAPATSHADIYVTMPVPNYKPGCVVITPARHEAIIHAHPTHSVYGMNHTVMNVVLPDIVPRIIAPATSRHPALDIFDCMGGAGMTHPEWIADGCHPNAAGYAALAKCFQVALGL